MTDGAFYSGNLPFSKHQSADRPNFVLGIQKVLKRSFLNKTGTNEAILTVSSAFYSENLPLSKLRSAEFRSRDTKAQKTAKKEFLQCLWGIQRCQIPKVPIVRISF
jgi:hypothetical protein